METVKTEKLGFWKKFAFGMGDIYGGGSGVVIGFYYLVFLTDVIRINPGLAGTVILISKLYDAVTDPFEGLIVDHTRTRWGRRRPYLIAGIPLVFLSFFLMWYPFALQNEILRFVFVVLTYLFFSTIVSIVMLSYNAIIPELTTDYHERTAISSFRIFFSTVASIISAVLPLEIVKLFPDIRQGYIVMALIFGLFYALPFIATVAVVKERKEYLEHSPAKLDLREGFIEPFKIKSFVFVLFMYLLAFVAMDVVSSVVVYFMKNYLERPGDITLVNGTLLVFQVIALPFYVWLSKRTSKRTGYIIGAIIWMTVMLTSLLMSPLTPRLAVYAFAAAIGLGTGGIVVMIYAIFPDIPDIGELSNGKRQEGTYSALTGFMRKLSSAFSLFLVGNLLSLTGYKPPIENIVEGATKLIEQPQSPAFILALRLLFVLVPLVLLGAAIALAWRYPLTAALHQKLLGVLKKLRKGGNEKKAAEKDSNELKALLIGRKK